MDPSFRRFAEECPDAVIVTDAKGRIEYVNPACERMTGYARGELAGRTPAVLKSGVHEADFYRELWATILAGREFRAVFTNRNKAGALYYEEKIIRPLASGGGRISHFVSFGRDATTRSHEIEELKHAATHDSLTDLPNRSLFLDRLGQSLRHAIRTDEAFVVALLDIDSFRETNNRYGHLAGDAVLQAVGARTRGCVREADTVARTGGDEFSLILAGADRASAAIVLQKIVAANAAAVIFDGRSIHATVSVGAAAYPDDARSEDDLRAGADRAMYTAKAQGGNRYGFCKAAGG